MGAAPPPHLALTGEREALRERVASDGMRAPICCEAAEDNASSLCHRHRNGDRASISVWCRPMRSVPRDGHAVSTRCQRPMTPGPIQRKKAKNLLLGGVCLLTTGGLISVSPPVETFL